MENYKKENKELSIMHELLSVITENGETEINKILKRVYDLELNIYVSALAEYATEPDSLASLLDYQEAQSEEVRKELMEKFDEKIM